MEWKSLGAYIMSALLCFGMGFRFAKTGYKYKIQNLKNELQICQSYEDSDEEINENDVYEACIQYSPVQYCKCYSKCTFEKLDIDSEDTKAIVAEKMKRAGLSCGFECRKK